LHYSGMINNALALRAEVTRCCNALLQSSACAVVYSHSTPYLEAQDKVKVKVKRAKE
jgi:hypothetical protein